MAASQKKTGAGGGSTSGKRSAGSRSGTAAKSRSAPKGAKEKTTTTPKPIRREVGAVVCLLLALFSSFGYVSNEAIFINWFCGLLKGLLGYGFWFMPPALLWSAFILAFHKGRPVRGRVSCALALPLLLSCLLHLFLAEGTYVWSMELPGQLWGEGLSVQSGGVLGGVLGISFTQAFGKAGTAIVIIVCGLLMLMVAAHVSFGDVAEFFRSRPHPAYEEEDYPVPMPSDDSRQRPREEPERGRHRDVSIDIPVGDEPPVLEEVTGNRKDRLFDRNVRVRRPDEVLCGGEEKSAPPAPVCTPVPQKNPEPVPQAKQVAPLPVVEPTSAPEIVREPAVPKVKKAEVEQAAAEVEEAVSGSLETVQAYQYPPASLLHDLEAVSSGDATEELRTNQTRLEDTIQSFGIDARMVAVVRGPSVTRYELELDRGVKLNKLTNLADDIALSLGATGVRIAPIPDKISVVGIEVPNKLVTPVPIHDVIDSKEFRDHPSKVCFAVGKDISNRCIVGNIAKLPHMLIAGTTGSGKSVCTNSLIISLLYKATPEEVRLIMVDPKMVELGIYNGIPHLLIPVVTDPKKAAGALQWAVTEMMKRYRLFSEVGVRDLSSYNAVIKKTQGGQKLPQIVVVIDELADLMLVAAKEVEESICRVAQMGRAAGMHLIIATQRPSADVITGLMKANIPSRIAFAVASGLESRIILDNTGAEKLVGRGDMLYFPLGSGKPQRVQGCLIADDEVTSVVEFVKRSGTANYSDEVMQEIEEHAQAKEKNAKGGGESPAAAESSDRDELFPDAVEVVLETGQASVSMLQRRLKLGYSRAARLVDQMEEEGIVGPFEGSKPRQLLMTREQWMERKMGGGVALAVEPDGFVELQAAFGEDLDEDDVPPFDHEE